MLDVRLTTVTGKTYRLTGTDTTSQVLAPEEAFTALVATSNRSDMAVPGRSGTIPGVGRYAPIQVDIPFYIHADNGDEMEAIYKEFRQGWNVWKPGGRAKPCTLAVHADHPEGEFYLDLYADQPLPGVPVDMRRRTSTTITVKGFAPLGLFHSKVHTATGAFTITNTGDEFIYPKLRYSGAGGQVTSPSGATYTLPAAATSTLIDTDPQELRLDGAFPEGVAPGKSGTWRLPTGVTAEWSVLVADPWA